MRYTKQFLINVSLFVTLLIGSGCTNEVETGGGSNNNQQHPVSLTIHATKSDFSNPEQTDVPLTRTITEGYKTTFSEGDAIGLFAIKNNAIVDDVNNMKLTYTAEGNWSLPIDTKIYYYEGVTYIAYSPFNESVTVDVSKSASEIVESLVNNNNLQPATNQSAGYAASDLTISTSVADATDIENVTLTLDFKHKFSLLVITPKTFSLKITEPNNAGFTYYREASSFAIDTDARGVTLNEITPYKMTDGSFCAVMNTTKFTNLSVDYQSKNDKYIHYQGDDIFTFGAGKYYKLAVNNLIKTEETRERPLAPGDFVFYNASQDGIEIYPGDGALDNNGRIPNYGQAVGIVVTCDPTRMTDPTCKEKGWNHAYVIGFARSSGNNTWGDHEDAVGLDSYTKETGSTNMNGYSETTCLVTNYSSKYSIIIYILNQIRGTKIPANLVNVRSDWFIPSVGQYYDLLANLCGKSPADFPEDNDNFWAETTDASAMYSRLEGHYAKLGKSLLLSGNFWSSSECDTNNAWSILISPSEIRLQPMDKRNYIDPPMSGHGFFAF